MAARLVHCYMGFQFKCLVISEKFIFGDEVIGFLVLFTTKFQFFIQWKYKIQASEQVANEIQSLGFLCLKILTVKHRNYLALIYKGWEHQLLKSQKTSAEGRWRLFRTLSFAEHFC